MTRIGLSMLIAFDENDIAFETLESCHFLDEQGHAVDLIDFEAHELAGGQLTDIWFVEQDQPAIEGQAPPAGWSVCAGGWVHGHVEGSPITPEPCPGGEWRKPAAGSGTWPQWLDARGWKAERSGPPGQRRITALIHPTSGFRRERAAIEGEIERRLAEKRAEADQRTATLRASFLRLRDAAGRFISRQLIVIEPEPADLRDLLGGPDAPLVLDGEGRTLPRPQWSGSPPHLPVAGSRLEEPVEPGARAEGDGSGEPQIRPAVPVTPGE